MLGMFHCHSSDSHTNPHNSLQKTKTLAPKKAQNCTSNRILNCTSFNNQIRLTHGVKEQIFRKILTHGRRDSISVYTQMKLN